MTCPILAFPFCYSPLDPFAHESILHSRSGKSDIGHVIQVFRILQNEKLSRNYSIHCCDQYCYIMALANCKWRAHLKIMPLTVGVQAGNLVPNMCSDFPVMEMAVAAVILNTLWPLCYWCQAAFLMNERPHPNVTLPLFSGCSKADVCGLPLSWRFWVLCCENLLENHVILWKDWPVFKG